MSLLTTIIFLLIYRNTQCFAEEVAFRILGGNVCDSKDYPFVVHVRSLVYCGGTLIHDVWVLTAAHCFFRDALVHNTEVRAGANGGEENIQIRKAISLVQYPTFVRSEFDKGNMVHDIGLIQIDSPFKVTPWTRVHPLPKFGKRTWKWNFSWGFDEEPTTTPTTTTTTTTTTNDPLTWGRTYYNGPCLNPTLVGTGDSTLNGPYWKYEDESWKTRKFKCANFSFVHYERCARIIKEVNPDAIFCLYHEHNYGCAGDNGGPLVCDNIGVVGVFSLPLKGCKDAPLICSRVDYYRNWIDHVMETKGRKNRPISKKSKAPNRTSYWELVFLGILLWSKLYWLYIE